MRSRPVWRSVSPALARWPAGVLLARRGSAVPRVGAVIAGSIGALVLLTSCARPSAQRLNSDGNHAYSRGDYPAALEDYRKAQVERPDLATLNYNAGNVLHQQGEYQRGITESLRATRGADADTQVRAFYTVGSDYYREGKLKEALDAFKSALRVDPSDLDAKYNVEVIQRRLDKEAQQRKQVQDQAQNQQQAQPTPQVAQASPTPSASSQAQPGQQQQQQGQQPQQAQQPQPGQPGSQQQPGQGAATPPPGASQPQQGQPGQPGQPNPNGQPSQSGQTQSGGGQPGTPQPSGAGASGAAATPVSPADARAQQAQLNQDLRQAVDAYQKAPTIEEALRILDILAEQERIAQAEQGVRGDPRSGDK